VDDLFGSGSRDFGPTFSNWRRTPEYWWKSEEVEWRAGELRAVNEKLWRAEDEIRLCESRRGFGEEFIEWARSIYRDNDRRAAIKRSINELFGSPYLEEKVYPAEE
jgi:hypothetical protein